MKMKYTNLKLILCYMEIFMNANFVIDMMYGIEIQYIHVIYVLKIVAELIIKVKCLLFIVWIVIILTKNEL